MPSISDQNILEIAVFNVGPGTEADFKTAMKTVVSIVSRADGYIGHDLRLCFELNTRFLLIVEWRSVADHLEKFAHSPAAAECRAATKTYLTQSAVVEHYIPVA